MRFRQALAREERRRTGQARRQDIGTDSAVLLWTVWSVIPVAAYRRMRSTRVLYLALALAALVAVVTAGKGASEEGDPDW